MFWRQVLFKVSRFCCSHSRRLLRFSSATPLRSATWFFSTGSGVLINSQFLRRCAPASISSLATWRTCVFPGRPSLKKQARFRFRGVSGWPRDPYSHTPPRIPPPAPPWYETVQREPLGNRMVARYHVYWLSEANGTILTFPPQQYRVSIAASKPHPGDRAPRSQRCVRSDRGAAFAMSSIVSSNGCASSGFAVKGCIFSMASCVSRSTARGS